MNAPSPLDLLLMHYAAGNLSPPEQLLVAAHLTLNPEARRRVSQYEALGGKLMCESEPASLRDECLSAVMLRIETPAGAAEKPARCQPAPDLHIPAAIYALISAFCGANAGCWSQVTQGFMKMDLRECAERRPAPMPAVRALPPRAAAKNLRLMKLAPRQAAPRHSHHGAEITLLLHGAFHDETGRYRKGDIVIIADPRVVHQPVAEDDGCVCLTLTEAPLRFEDPFQRFMNAFRRI